MSFADRYDYLLQTTIGFTVDGQMSQDDKRYLLLVVQSVVDIMTLQSQFKIFGVNIPIISLTGM